MCSHRVQLCALVLRWISAVETHSALCGRASCSTPESTCIYVADPCTFISPSAPPHALYDRLIQAQSGQPANERAWAADTRFPLRS
jgi:hypothetical protein